MLFAGSGWVSDLLSVGGEEIGFWVGLRDDESWAEKREGLLYGPVGRNHLARPSPTGASLGVLECLGKSILIRSCHISSTG